MPHPGARNLHTGSHPPDSGPVHAHQAPHVGTCQRIEHGCAYGRARRRLGHRVCHLHRLGRLRRLVLHLHRLGRLRRLVLHLHRLGLVHLGPRIRHHRRHVLRHIRQTPPSAPVLKGCARICSAAGHVAIRSTRRQARGPDIGGDRFPGYQCSALGFKPRCLARVVHCVPGVDLGHHIPAIIPAPALQLHRQPFDRLRCQEQKGAPALGLVDPAAEVLQGNGQDVLLMPFLECGRPYRHQARRPSRRALRLRLQFGRLRPAAEQGPVCAHLLGHLLQPFAAVGQAHR